MSRKQRRGGFQCAAQRAALVLGILSVGIATPARSQQPAPATPFTPPHHWTHDAARRLATLGLAPPGFDVARRTLTIAELTALFTHAQRVAADRATAHAPLVRGYAERLREEFGASARPAGEGVRVEARVGAGWERRVGNLRGGIGPDTTSWIPPAPLPDVRDAILAGTTTALLERYVALTLSWQSGEGNRDIVEGYGVAAAGPIGAWGGRRVVGFGPATGGGVVLGAERAFDGGGVFLRDAVRGPGFLGSLGPLRAELSVARLARQTRVGRPWLLAMRGSMEPHPRLTLGVSRAAMFGGEENTDVSVRNLLYLLVGKHSGEQGEFDNQVVALDAVYRVPLGSVPLQLYGEWGFDDSAGAWKDVPGYVIGSYVAAVPRLPSLALGAEYTSYARSCCGNTIWYRNWQFWEGWTDEGRPLAHELGGHGDEWRAYAQVDALDARVRLHGAAFTRERGNENLFAPTRTGDSRGFEFALRWRALREVELEARGAYERGDGWTGNRQLLTASWIH